ncbi:hypothetical protein HanPSC8_Chr14g0595211 [Helianthus annuus]|nr:hypothetical protein HanPSC8_Chr14g0595211 [Helianthus annuus]
MIIFFTSLLTLQMMNFYVADKYNCYIMVRIGQFINVSIFQKDKVSLHFVPLI